MGEVEAGILCEDLKIHTGRCAFHIMTGQMETDQTGIMMQKTTATKHFVFSMQFEANTNGLDSIDGA